MRNALVPSVLSVLVAFHAGCAAPTDDDGTSVTTEPGSVEQTAYVKGNAGGTNLMIYSGGVSQSCSGTGAYVDLDGWIVSSASGTTAIITATGSIEGLSLIHI